MSHLNHEAIGNEMALDLLNELLHTKTQADAVQLIALFIEQMGNVPSKRLRAYAAGASAALVEVLLLGMAAVRERADHEA